jgi:DNA-binding transcriptional MerR regulator
MYQISAFSKISSTSIQTLRYYDNLDLLKPKIIGKYNSYRYYTNDQLIKLKIIKRLKSMGFKLKEISMILNNYDEKYLVSHKKRIQSEVNSNKKTIKEIEDIISKMKNKKQGFEKELVNLINIEERRKLSMKEKYTDAKEKLLKCYELYKKDSLDDCLVSLEELKHDIFNSNNEMDPFWLDSAGDLFAGITFEIFKNNKAEDVTFINIFQFRINGKEYIDNITEYTNSLAKDSYSYICLSGISATPIDTRSSIISVFKQRMKLYAMFDVKK